MSGSIRRSLAWMFGVGAETEHDPSGAASVQIGDYYVIVTNMSPQEVNRLTLEVYARWLDFALGHTVLNGRRIVNPTGRYSRSLQVKYEDGIAVGVVADPSIAPEAAMIEHGHASVDLKNRLMHGRAYPMHRAGLPPRIGGGPNGIRSRMWSQIKSRTATGFASIGPNSSPDSWILPSMPAYSPSATLAAMVSDEARRRGG
jgi:hypothetical protein